MSKAYEHSSPRVSVGVPATPVLGVDVISGLCDPPRGEPIDQFSEPHGLAVGADDEGEVVGLERLESLGLLAPVVREDRSECLAHVGVVHEPLQQGDVGLLDGMEGDAVTTEEDGSGHESGVAGEPLEPASAVSAVGTLFQKGFIQRARRPMRANPGRGRPILRSRTGG